MVGSHSDGHERPDRQEAEKERQEKAGAEIEMSPSCLFGQTFDWIESWISVMGSCWDGLGRSDLKMVDEEKEMKAEAQIEMACSSTYGMMLIYVMHSR